MPLNLIRPARDQLMLLPVDVRDWLGEDDIVWHVLDVVAELDLSGFYARYRSNGQGAAAFDPAMMLALVIYAHAVGVRSSRAIERACTRDAGFKVVTGQLVPDHCTISRFVKDHRDALVGLFAQVLRLCHAAGMTRVGVIAIDGTKIAANASWAKSYTDAALAHRIAEEQRAFTELAAGLVGEQVALDDAEDAEHGPDRRGDELPAQLRRREERLQRLRQARADLQARDDAARERMRAEQKAKQADFDARKAAGRARGPRPLDEVAIRGLPSRGPHPARASVTDPDSRRMKAKHGFVQGYNAQAAVTDTQVIVGATVTQTPTDHHLLPEVLAATEQQLAEAGIAERPTTVVADAGYANEDTFAAAEAADITVLAPVTSDEKRVRGQNPTGCDPVRRPATARAQQRLATPEGQHLYAMRGRTIEPVFGQLKDRLGLRQFTRRGLSAVTAEFLLACTVHNIRKLHSWTPTAALT